MPVLEQITNPAQDNAPLLVNENFIALEHQACYAYDWMTSSGLTWGFLGGRWGGFAIAGGTLALTDNATNYLVVEIATGIHTASATDTDWNDDANFAHVYKVPTSGGAVVTASIEDHRGGPGGIFGGAGAGGGGGGTGIDGGVPDSTYGATTPIDGGTP